MTEHWMLLLAQMIHVTQYNKLTCDDDNECTTVAILKLDVMRKLSCNEMVVILALDASTLM